MTIGLTWRRTARRIKRLNETVLAISQDYSDRPTPDFLTLSYLTCVNFLFLSSAQVQSRPPLRGRVFPGDREEFVYRALVIGIGAILQRRTLPSVPIRKSAGSPSQTVAKAHGCSSRLRLRLCLWL